MRVFDSVNSVDCNIEWVVCVVFEFYGEIEIIGKFVVKLVFGGVCIDSINGEYIGKELWRDGIEDFSSDGYVFVGEVDEELMCKV